MFKQVDIIIPAGISKEAIRQKRRGLLAFVFGLKTMYESGMIKCYYNRREAISKYLGISVKTFNKYINLLQENNLIRIEKGNLYLRSKEFICKHFGLEYNYHYKYKLKFIGVKDLQNQLQALSLNDNFYQQSSAKRNKLKDRLKNNSKREARIILKLGRVKDDQSFSGLGSDVTLSQKGIANVYGSAHKSVGNYWSKKLERLGKIRVAKTDAKLLRKNVGSKEWAIMRDESHKGKSMVYSRTKLMVFEVKPNKIKIVL